MNLVKLKFLRNGEPSGREYTYISNDPVEVGDVVVVREAEEGKQAPFGIITQTGVPETEVETFKDKLKTIIGKGYVQCEKCENLVACGEGDHICGAGKEKAPILDYRPTSDYGWCKGARYRAN